MTASLLQQWHYFVENIGRKASVFSASLTRNSTSAFLRAGFEVSTAGAEGEGEDGAREVFAPNFPRPFNLQTI